MKTARKMFAVLLAFGAGAVACAGTIRTVTASALTLDTRIGLYKVLPVSDRGVASAVCRLSTRWDGARRTRAALGARRPNVRPSGGSRLSRPLVLLPTTREGRACRDRTRGGRDKRVPPARPGPARNVPAPPSARGVRTAPSSPPPTNVFPRCDLPERHAPCVAGVRRAWRDAVQCAAEGGRDAWEAPFRQMIILISLLAY